MKYSSLFIGLVISFSLSSYAQWSKEARDQILKTAKEYNVKGPPGYVSLWGGVKRSWRSTDNKGDIREYHLKEFFKKGSLPIYFYEQKERAPLTIFFPGIFGQEDGELTPSMLDLLEKNNTHVAMIPNFLSKNYIKSEPRYGEDASHTDISAATKLVEKILLSLNPQKVSHINFVAESLGSFVASGVLAQLNQNKKLENYQINLVLMWPPLQLAKVLSNFDQQIHDTLKIFKSCSFWYRYPMAYYHFVWQKTPQNVSEDFMKCMDSYLYHGVFRKGMEKTIAAAREVRQDKKKKGAPKDFQEYFQELNQNFYKMLQNKDEKLNLAFWLRQRNLSQTNVRIISSLDDFINKDVNWENFLTQSYLSKKNLILLPWGAHSGGLAMEGWDKILKMEIIPKGRKKVTWPFSVKSI